MTRPNEYAGTLEEMLKAIQELVTALQTDQTLLRADKWYGLSLNVHADDETKICHGITIQLQAMQEPKGN